MYTASLACVTAAAIGKGHDQSQTGLASNLMWQNTQLPVICESNRPHSLFSRHMRASSFATFTFCSSPLSLSSHLLPGVGFPHPTCLMERNGLAVRLYWISRLSNLLLPPLSQSNQEVSLEFCSIQTEDEDGKSWMDSADFNFFVCMCMKNMLMQTWMKMRYSHSETHWDFSLALTVMWTSPATLQVLKKCQQQKIWKEERDNSIRVGL